MKLYIKKLNVNGSYWIEGISNHHLNLSLSIIEKVKAARDPT
ncbi:hypothetical protein [Dellaglioa algida]|nr:hypothetical protein [Dellaglioa algida]MDK1728055.1 hypothetical protein [Dellaglioa algida]MDK1735548.1 hypothetical protein [Dellaglioa algida]MDK1737386.1 hypothetical protein [Dellaglioa algida]